MSTPDWDWEGPRAWDLNVEQFILFDDTMKTWNCILICSIVYREINRAKRFIKLGTHCTNKNILYLNAR